MARQFLTKTIDKTYAVVPVLAPVPTADVVLRYAVRFNDGEDFEGFAVDVRQAVERNLRRLRERGAIEGPPWKRVSG